MGASNVYGKGVARSQAFPAQLEALLRAKGHAVRVINAGVNGETTDVMLARVDRVVPDGTKLVILEAGDNDRRKARATDTAANIAAIEARLRARKVGFVLVGSLRGLPFQPDREHLTAEGHRLLAARLVPQVSAALGR
jgi:acyl-CoA thioesterase-1